MKIAVISSGSAGLIASWLLSQKYSEVEVFINSATLNVFSRTINLENHLSIDNGFIIYPEKSVEWLFKKLSIEYDVVPKELRVCFYNNRQAKYFNAIGKKSMMHYFAHHRIFHSIKRFINILSEYHRTNAMPAISTGAFIEKNQFSENFLKYYLNPVMLILFPHLERQEMHDLPLDIFWDLYSLYLYNPAYPDEKLVTIKSGGSSFTSLLIDLNKSKFHTDIQIKKIIREGDGVRLIDDSGQSRCYDEVIIDKDADDALSLIENPDARENTVLGGFHFKELYLDIISLPLHESLIPNTSASVVYFDNHPLCFQNVSKLHSVNDKQNQYLIVYNYNDIFDKAEKISRRMVKMPVYSMNQSLMRREVSHFIRHNKVSYIGNYWGKGVQAGSIISAFDVAKAFSCNF